MAPGILPSMEETKGFIICEPRILVQCPSKGLYQNDQSNFNHNTSKPKYPSTGK